MGNRRSSIIVKMRNSAIEMKHTFKCTVPHCLLFKKRKRDTVIVLKNI